MRFIILLVFFTLLGCERGEPDREVAGIVWISDYGEAVRKAEEDGKPVFIYFSAVWCSWCREYESSLREVRGLLEASFIPLLLDSDRERKLFIEFGGRGTPFTVVLSPEGRVLLKFHGSLKPEDLKDLLRVVLARGVYREVGKETYRLLAVNRKAYRFLFEHFLYDLRTRYDPVFGGFSSPSAEGTAFKWSTPLTYIYLLERDLMVEEVIFSLKKDIEFLYDSVDGGFFNFYDRTRAYDIYFETSKTLGVNSLMMLALLEAYKKNKDRLFLDRALGIYRYLKNILYEPRSGCFLNAQISDPSYYNLKPEERKRRKPPPTDTAIITEENAKTMIALLELYRLTGERRFLDEIKRCANYILSELLTPEGLYRYYDIRTGRRGLLNFGRDIAFLSLAFHELAREERRYRKDLKRVLSLGGAVKERVSRYIIAYLMAVKDPKAGEAFLKGTEVNLSYANPDEFVYLLRTLELITGAGPEGR